MPENRQQEENSSTDVRFYFKKKSLKQPESDIETMKYFQANYVTYVHTHITKNYQL